MPASTPPTDKLSHFSYESNQAALKPYHIDLGDNPAKELAEIVAAVSAVLNGAGGAAA